MDFFIGVVDLIDNGGRVLSTLLNDLLQKKLKPMVEMIPVKAE